MKKQLWIVGIIAVIILLVLGFKGNLFSVAPENQDSALSSAVVSSGSLGVPSIKKQIVEYCVDKIPSAIIQEMIRQQNPDKTIIFKICLPWPNGGLSPCFAQQQTLDGLLAQLKQLQGSLANTKDANQVAMIQAQINRFVGYISSAQAALTSCKNKKTS